MKQITITWWRWWTVGYKGVVVLAVVGWSTVLTSVWYVGFRAQTIHFSYANADACVADIALLPRHHRSPVSSEFITLRTGLVHVLGQPILATKLCAIAVQPPRPNKEYATSNSFVLSKIKIAKQVNIQTGSYSRIISSSTLTNLLPKTMVSFTIDQPDVTFRYALRVVDKQSLCTSRSRVLECDTTPLNLSYGQKYTAILARSFKQQKVDDVKAQLMQTITATTITSSSIAGGSEVFDKSQQLTLQTDKTLTAIGTIIISYNDAASKPVVIPSTAVFKDKSITITTTQLLPRHQQITVAMASLAATDGSALAVPYQLQFKTSGGPRVTAVNAPASKLGLNQAINISFDQGLSPLQDVKPFISLLVNGAVVASTISRQGKTITVTPSAAYPMCAKINLKISGDITNVSDVGGDSTYNFSGRVICQTIISIGQSVQGRAILAYKFGAGPSQILYIGGTHGTEQNSSNILNKWINELESNPDRIPANRSIVVIPQINPDGLAITKRFNANNIDLNRNFPAKNWKSVVTLPDRTVSPAGGSAPLTEPESQALANYALANRPRLTLTYHSRAGIVEANEAGDSLVLASRYASFTGYRAIPTSAIGNTFAYDTTGAFEDWLKDKLALPAFVIELTSATNDEFTKNREAMWTMVQLP